MQPSCPDPGEAEGTPDRADALARLHAACFEYPRPWRAAEFAALLEDPSIILVSSPGGFGLARLAADEGEILTLAVAPDARRQGIGAALLGGMLDRLRNRGAGRVFLEVAADNAAARALYARAGFDETGRRPRYYGTGAAAMDALILFRKL